MIKDIFMIVLLMLSFQKNQVYLSFMVMVACTGITFLWHTIINRIHSEGLIVLAVASSGIA
jgi:hypothetical protein